MSFLSDIFKKSSRRVIGLDIGTSSIKAVQLYERSGRVYLDTYGTFLLGPYVGSEAGYAAQTTPEQTSRVIQDMLEQGNFSSKRSVVSIPLNSSIISIIEMPNVSEKQLDQMVPLEAKKYIPSSLDEVMLDWSLVGERKIEVEEEGSEKKEQVKRKEVMLVAIHQEALDRQQNIVEQAGLEASAYEMEVFTTYRATLGGSSAGVVMVVDIGASLTKLYIISDGVVRASHSINRGSQDITKSIASALDLSDTEAEMVKRDVGISGDHPQIHEAAGLTLEHLFDEIRRLINTYQSRYSRAVERLIISGGGGALPGLDKKAQDSLELKIETARPFDQVTAPEFLKSNLERIGPEFTVAIGSALRGLEED